jgi:hypothetical protein
MPLPEVRINKIIGMARYLYRKLPEKEIGEVVFGLAEAVPEIAEVELDHGSAGPQRR